MEFRQEYLAEFVANAASMFLLSEGTVLPHLEPPEGWITVGCDWAKKEDFSVISGCNTETRRPCLLERFNDISWPVQLDILEGILEGLDADPLVEGYTVVVDATGIGDVVFDDLEDRGIDVVPVNFASGLQKERMAVLLAADLEHHRAWITEQERSEFERFEYNILPSGRRQFEASAGHDDYVAAKMLQNWGCVHEAAPGVQVIDTNAEANEERESVTVRTVKPDDRADIAANPAAWG
jgi:hypothetical protein